MDIFEETKAPLTHIWKNDQQRQATKMVIIQAIANVTELTAKEADSITDELDRMLAETDEPTPEMVNRGL